MNQRTVRMVTLGNFALIVALTAASLMPAQDAKSEGKTYNSIAPIEQYLMTDRNAEIALARSAAPDSVSRDAEILILERLGYKTAVKGKNGFVCLVERSWMAPFDDPEFLNPDQRVPLCLNPPAAQTHLPLVFKATELGFAGLSKTQMFNSIKAAFDKKQLPLPAPGSMCYMMSKQQFFNRKVGNADPHLMFWFPQQDHLDWGADSPDSPVDVHQYSPEPVTEFSISVSKWSDGTPANTQTQRLD